MRRKIVLGLVLMLGLIGVLMPFTLRTVKGQKVWFVYGGGGTGIDFTTIQEAVNAASDGDWIYVFNGTYTEQLDVSKTLRLVGESPSNTIIEVPASGSGAVALSKNDSLVYNFKIIQSLQNLGSNIVAIGIALEVSGCTVTNNTIQGINGTGIAVVGSGKATIMHNTVNNCSDIGIGINGSDECIVAANVISQCGQGIFLGIYGTGSTGNNFTQNNVTSCTQAGIHVVTDGNLFYHNNIIGNTLQANISAGTLNTWNNDTYPESGGNYWSNYAGADANADGLGDTPHVLDAINQDNYPLHDPVSTESLTQDINGDRRIDMRDIGAVVSAYGGIPFGLGWNPFTDLNVDLRTEMRDIGIECVNFGKHYP